MDDPALCVGSNASPAPLRAHIAFVRDQFLFRKTVTSQREYRLARLSQSTSNGVVCIKWSHDAGQILLIHDSALQVIDSDSGDERIRLLNGSGSLGLIASADFVGPHHLLVIWHFGKTKIFHLSNGKALDLPDLKTTCDRTAWQLRPGNATPPLFALLGRTTAGDQLGLQFSSQQQALTPTKLLTVDAQLLSWSPDGRWLAVLDVPTATPSLYIYTPDGHLFRSYPSKGESEPALGVKSVVWSPDGQRVALSKYDGKIELCSTRTFSPLAVIEHTTTINQASRITEERAPVWLEQVAASGERMYHTQNQPVSPPLSKAKADLEPKEIGVAELSFNSNGQYLSSRDCRMLNTIWLWDMSRMSIHTVLIQHANVRTMQWHPTRPEILLIDCAEGFAHVFDVASNTPPTILPTQMRPKTPLSWIPTAPSAKVIILAAEKTRFNAIFPEGRHELDNDTPQAISVGSDAAFEEGEGEGDDSLFDVLSGRKPLPPKTEPSYTEMVDLDMEVEDAIDGGAMEDTFREKKKKKATTTTTTTTKMKMKVMQAQDEEVDPFDDSQIF